MLNKYFSSHAHKPAKAAALCAALAFPANAEPSFDSLPLFTFTDSSIKMFSDFVHVCTEDHQRQAIFPLALEYQYAPEYEAVGERIPELMMNYVGTRMVDTLDNPMSAYQMIRHDASFGLITGGRTVDYTRGLGDSVDGWVNFLYSGPVAFAPGCNADDGRFSHEIYDELLGNQNTFREHILRTDPLPSYDSEPEGTGWDTQRDRVSFRLGI